MKKPFIFLMNHSTVVASIAGMAISFILLSFLPVHAIIYYCTQTYFFVIFTKELEISNLSLNLYCLYLRIFIVIKCLRDWRGWKTLMAFLSKYLCSTLPRRQYRLPVDCYTTSISARMCLITLHVFEVLFCFMVRFQNLTKYEASVHYSPFSYL